MRRSRALAAVGTGVLALALLTSSAAAATVTSNDPAGDGVGPGDVRAVRLSYDTNTVHVRLRLQAPIDLDTSPAWIRAGSASVLRVNIDIDDDPAVDYIGVIEPGAGAPVVSLRNNQPLSPSPRIVCAFVEQPQPTMIDLNFRPTCIDDAEHVRAFARFRLDRGGDGTVDSDDRAPNFGWTPVFQFIF